MFDTHYEKELVVDNKEFHYEGIFRYDELFRTIALAIQEKGYTKREKRTEENVTPEGKSTYVELRPYKIKTNYAVLMIKVKVQTSNVKDIMQDVHGEMRNMQKGKLDILYEAWVLTDYESRWGMKPVVYFLKSVINKYLYTFPLEAGFKGEAIGDAHFIFNKVKDLTRSYAAREETFPPEEDVIKAMRKEFKEEKKSGFEG